MIRQPTPRQPRVRRTMRDYLPTGVGDRMARRRWEELGRVCAVCEAKTSDETYCFGCDALICPRHPMTDAEGKVPAKHTVEFHRVNPCQHDGEIVPYGWPKEIGRFCTKCYCDV